MKLDLNFLILENKTFLIKQYLFEPELMAKVVCVNIKQRVFSEFLLRILAI